MVDVADEKSAAAAPAGASRIYDDFDQLIGQIVGAHELELRLGYHELGKIRRILLKPWILRRRQTLHVRDRYIPASRLA